VSARMGVAFTTGEVLRWNVGSICEKDVWFTANMLYRSGIGMEPPRNACGPRSTSSHVPSIGRGISMAQSPSKPKRSAKIIEALRAQGMKDQEVASIQAKLDPLLLEEPEVHIHVEGDDTHIHVDVHEFE
jgi:hypothetical protein